MPKKTESNVSFEQSLLELESIVQRLESGSIPLDDALNEFERGITLARQGQQQLLKAEQRVQILLAQDDQSGLADFTAEH